MPILECTHLTKSFNGIPVVREATFSAQAGELITLLGPSGCGKTTTLRLIAGFEWPDSGTINVRRRVVAGDGVRVPPEERRIGMVFQDYALFPHLDVAGNIAFGLRGSKPQIAQRVGDLLHLVGLNGLDKRMTYELSGGQQQRVALARALAPQPELLLLDEPFSNLDAALRAQVRAEVKAILKTAGITCVFVTHDQEEALSLADQVAVIFDGHIAQFAAPQMVYHAPATRQVAAFVGEANFLPAHAHGEMAECALGTVILREHQQGAVELLLRPEALQLATDSAANAVVLWTEFYGYSQRVGLRLNASSQPTLIARAPSDLPISAGMPVHVTVRGAVRAFRA